MFHRDFRAWGGTWVFVLGRTKLFCEIKYIVWRRFRKLDSNV
jgi:hypothetical protein